MKILVVEDEALLCLVYNKDIKQLGHEMVAHVDNGPSAIEAVKKFRPDLILMDIFLRGEMNGIQAMTEIRKFSDIPVIYVTSNSDPSNLERARKTNFVDYLVKPIDQIDLGKALKKVGDT